MAETPETDRQPDALLRRAYEERDRQLGEARGALAELVSEVIEELREVRGHNAQLREERSGLVAECNALRQEVDKQLRGVADLNARLAALQDMKVVRWTAPLRGFVYRLRGR